MICARCSRENKAGRKFCAACGAALPLACPACGFENDPDDAFCGGCGRALGAAPAAPPPSAPPPSAPPPSAPGRVAPGEAERRQLTVLFSDLVGSTALSTRLDPEDLGDLIRGYQEVCAAEVARWEGYIARYMGDGILVYFGWPRAHEDDAQRAVRAGLGIVQAARPLGVSVRVGVATGVAVVGDLVGAGSAQEQAVVGETPNLAARMQSLAAADTVAVSESTARLLGGLFETEDLGPHALKGFDEPVRAYRVVRPRDVASRFEARRTGGLAPMVGRERELGLLTDRWAATRGGDGQVVLLGSEAGLGKSRLVAALEESIAGEPHRIVRLQGSAHQQTSPLRPAIEWLVRAAGIEPDDPPSRRLERLEALVPPAVRADRVPFLAELLSIPTDGRWDVSSLPAARKKELALAALVGQITDGAKERPTLVLFEDVQWADPSSETLIDRLVDRAASCHCFVLLTFRSELSPRWAGRAHATQLGLARLTPPQSRALLAALAGDRALPPAAVDAIVARADGVPLFLEELGRGALESGALAIPATLQESLLARLDRLPGSREVAQTAAVLGREFEIETLAVALERAPALVRPALDELVGAALLLDHGEGRYSFKHALVRDVAYESLLRRTRRAMHAAVARALQAARGVADAQPELVAYHLEAAGEPDVAVTWWQRAAKRAEAQWSYAEAAAHLARAIALSDPPDLDAERAARLVALRIEQANALRVVERFEQALAALDAALPVAERFDLAELLSRLHFTRGNLLFWLQRNDDCMAAHTLALTEARRAGSAEAEARAHGGLGDAHYARGAMTSALASFRQCVELARENGFPEIEADNLPMVGDSWMWLGDPATALPDFSRAVALAEQTRRPRAETIARGGYGGALADLGRIEEAATELRRAAEIARRLGAPGLELSARVGLVDVLEGTGRIAEARAALVTLMETVTGRGAEFFGPSARSRLARLDGDRELLRASLDALGEGLSSWHMGLPWLFTDHARSALDLGDWDGLERVLRLAAGHPPPEPMPYMDARLRCFAALGAVRRGLRDDATRAAVAQALQALASVGHPFTIRKYEEELAAAF